MVYAMATIAEVIPSAVRAERARLKMSQQELADLLGWSVATVRDLEADRRRPAVDDLPLLCEAFGVTLAVLLDRAEPADLQRLGLL
jgi:transcriptional regulator with XRE-family HTH domain